MSIDSSKFAMYPIVGPTDSVIRFLRGETVWPHEIEEDTSRSDVWVCNREQYERWRIISPQEHSPLPATHLEAE